MIKKILTKTKTLFTFKKHKVLEEKEEEYDLSDIAFTDFLNEMEKLELYKKEVKNEAKR